MKRVHYVHIEKTRTLGGTGVAHMNPRSGDTTFFLGKTIKAVVQNGGAILDESRVVKVLMHEGKVGSIVDLATLLPNDHLYAVGALSELRGEITILGGGVYIAYPEGADGVRLDIFEDSDEAACLLVTAEVRDWVSVTTQSATPS